MKLTLSQAQRYYGHLVPWTIDEQDLIFIEKARKLPINEVENAIKNMLWKMASKGTPSPPSTEKDLLEAKAYFEMRLLDVTGPRYKRTQSALAEVNKKLAEFPKPILDTSRSMHDVTGPRYKS
jgi:hypothetical protein